MKWILSFGLLGSGLALSATGGKAAVAVTDFRQEVDRYYSGCKGYRWNYQHQLRTAMEAALSKHGLKVVERQHIGKLYANEHLMENLNPETKPAKMKFVAAKFAVTGAITELGVCEEEEGTGIDLGGVVSLLGGPQTDLKVKVGGAISKIKLQAKLVNTETGEVVKVFESETESKDKGLGVGVSVYGIGGKHKKQSTPPIERAANEGIDQLAQQIAEHLS